MPHQPFRDELADRRRTTLLLFYLAALLSVIAISLAGRILPFRTSLLALSVAGAGAAILFLLRFLRSNDERERQTNYRAGRLLDFRSSDRRHGSRSAVIENSNLNAIGKEIAEARPAVAIAEGAFGEPRKPVHGAVPPAPQGNKNMTTTNC